MGQRLVCTIEKDGKGIAAIYWHWNAYTYDALYTTKDVIDCIYDKQYRSVEDLQLRLIRFCERRGGGIEGSEKEFKYIADVFPGETFLSDGYSRNEGLIAISQRGIEELQLWSEGDVIIDIDTGKVTFSVFWSFGDENKYRTYRLDECGDDEVPDIVPMNFNLGFFDVDEIDGIIADLDEREYEVIKCGDEVYEFIR